MLQRIQSIYLTFSALLVVLSYFLPFGSINGLALRSYGIKSDDQYLDTINHYWFHLPLAVVVVITVLAIFSFANRARQMALVRSTFILFAISFALLAFFIMGAQQGLGGEFSAGISMLLLFVALMLNWLALRSIRKDDQLVKSVDRIR